MKRKRPDTPVGIYANTLLRKLRDPEWLNATELIELGPIMARIDGEVKWFNNAKGFGFLGQNAGPDVFIHYSSIEVAGYKSLSAGDLVSFDIIQGEKGPQADKVRRIDVTEVPSPPLRTL
jgi:CspA family cold shock protein